MKKTTRLIFSVILGICCLVPAVSAVEPRANVEKAVILSSYTIDDDSACDHSYTRVDVGDIVGESCTDTTYNYKVWCYNCRSYVTGGILVMPKDTPEHVMRWRTVSCIKGIHTYERYCVKCGYATESFSQECSGPPCPEIMSLSLN